MKVAYDSQIFTRQAYGGISRYFVKLLKELHEQHIDAKVFAGFYQNRYLGELPKQTFQGIALKKYPPRTGRLFKEINFFVCNRSVEKYSPDIFHETYYSSLGEPNSGGAPRFVTVYDMIHEKFPGSFLVGDSTSLDKLAAVKRADHVICISQSTKNDLCEIFNLDQRKVSVVYLGFDDFATKPVNRYTSSKRPYFLYVGQRKGYKNFALLLKAVASTASLFKNVDVLAFGGGGFDGEEQALIRRLGFAHEQIKQIHGNDQLLAETYVQALGLVYPSLYEGFGLPPLEAMARNCPVISSNTSSMPEVIGGAGEYFDPQSLDSISSAIEAVVFSKERMQELKKLGSERVKFFTWQRCGQETRTIYQSVLNAASSTRMQ